MKVSQIKQEVNSKKVLDVAFDVGKDKLNPMFELGPLRYADDCGNRSNPINAKLKEIMRIAREHGYETLRILCEPSGGYEKALLRIAHQLHFHTAYVGGEASSKFRMVVHGDPGKSDERDSQPLLAIAGQGKLLTHRVLPTEYELLRELNREYDWVSDHRVMVRCEIHALLVRLFPDLPVSSDFLYEPGGRALARDYGWNPRRIVDAGPEQLEKCLKTASRFVRHQTIAKIWEAALQSAEYHDEARGVSDYVTERLRRRYEEIERLDQQRQELCSRLEEVYLRLRENDPRLPGAEAGVVKLYMLARIVGETGPLSDFSDIWKLYRFAGLNLCRRQSGKYKGLTKISRKGRIPLRRILGRAVLPLVSKGGLYDAWYHGPDGSTKKGAKGMAALMRKFLKLLFGWYKSGREFDLKRVFTSASEYGVQAA